MPRPRASAEARHYAAPAAEKALDILEALAAEPEGATAAELCRILGRSMGEVYRVLLSLERRGYVAKDPGTERCHLTLRLFDLAHRHPPTARLVRAAQSVLDDLAAAAMQSCHLVVAEGAEAVVLATAASPMPMGYAVRVGARFPLMETSSGVVIVAFGRERVRREAFGAGEAPEDYAERIERVRRRGYEVWDSHVVRGVTNVAAPVLDHSGHACAAVTVPYLEQIRAEPNRSDVLARVVEAGVALSRAMGAAERPQTNTIPSREAEG
jgi:DNA-binding IclR family transcriptional regulator